MKVSDIKFAVHDYDHDGEINEEGFFLHIGNAKVKVAETYEDFRKIVGHLAQIVEEAKGYVDWEPIKASRAGESPKMTVADMVIWLATFHDQTAIVQVVVHSEGTGYYDQGGTAKVYDFDPKSHTEHYVWCTEPNKSTLLLGVHSD